MFSEQKTEKRHQRLIEHLIELKITKLVHLSDGGRGRRYTHISHCDAQHNHPSPASVWCNARWRTHPLIMNCLLKFALVICGWFGRIEYQMAIFAGVKWITVCLSTNHKLLLAIKLLAVAVLDVLLYYTVTKCNEIKKWCGDIQIWINYCCRIIPR